jgi:ATP-dependent DNA ligase
MSKLYAPLYSRNSRGKILSWEILVKLYSECNDSDDSITSVIIIYDGEMDGKKVETTNIITKGKNIGKMNQTTPYDQACSEAESRWNKKRKQGYKSMADLGIESLADLELALPKDRTDDNGNIKPMKAQQYFKDNGEVRIKFPCLGQAKLNGFRVIAKLETVEEGEGIFKQSVEKITFRSKEGLRYTVLQHIEEDFHKLFDYFKWSGFAPSEHLAFDGEMYTHGEILSEISSSVRKKNSKTPNLKFYVFDLAVEDITQEERNKLLSQLDKNIKGLNITNIVIVPSFPIGNNLIAQTFTDNQIKAGYEGAIFRDPKATYQFGKRPQTMVKLKRSQDKEFIVKDVISGEFSPDLGIFVCIAENGEDFKVTPEGTHEQKREYLLNKAKYIGKKLTVKFFERTKNGLPFHSVGVTIRDYE